MDEFKLTQAEKHSALWARLRKHMSERLEGLRAQNDHHQPESQTAGLRGKIAEVKEFLALEGAPEEGA